MLLRTLTAAAVLACITSVAQAGGVFGSNATSSFSSPIVSTSGADTDMNGAPNGTAAGFRNNTQQSGAVTFTVSWDVAGAESNIDWRLFVLGRTTARVSVTGITLLDDTAGTQLSAVSTNSMVVNTGPVSGTTVTMFDLTQFQSQSDYGTVQNGFNWTNIQRLIITFTLDNPVGTGARTPINIDAVSNPEPTTLALFGLGLLGLGAVTRRRRRGARAAS